MEENGCSQNGCIYNTIIQGFLWNNEILRAIQLLQEMLASNIILEEGLYTQLFFFSLRTKTIDRYVFNYSIIV